MAATLGSIKGKVLVQIGDREPVEVGEIDIPIELKTQKDQKPVYRSDDRDLGTLQAPHLRRA